MKEFRGLICISLLLSIVCAISIVGYYLNKKTVEVAPSTSDVRVIEVAEQEEEKTIESSIVEESIITEPSNSLVIESSSIIEEKPKPEKETKKKKTTKKKEEKPTEKSVESSVAPEPSIEPSEKIESFIIEPVESSVVVNPESSQIEVSKPSENGEAEQSNEKEVSSMSKEDKIRLWEAQNPPPTGKHLTKRGGVFQGPSGKETYYNLKMNGVLKNIVYGHEWKGSLGLDPDEYPYWVRSDGAKMVGPYIMCAAALDVRPYGTILDTSLGKAIVVDTGTFAKTNKKQIDIAVNW